jgi:phage anti-repressor protein
VPSHKDIQKTLVKNRVRERKFIGSKDWIGATEVSEVLNELIGVGDDCWHKLFLFGCDV